MLGCWSVGLEMFFGENPVLGITHPDSQIPGGASGSV